MQPNEIERNNEDHRTDFQKRVDKLSFKAWNTVQIVGGLLLGGIVSFFLFGGSSNEIMSMFTVYALVLALIVPKVVENLCGRSLNRARIAMVIAIAAIMIANVLIHSLTH